jgi:hypothetical protein
MKHFIFLAALFFTTTGWGQYLDFDDKEYPMSFESTTCYLNNYNTKNKKFEVSEISRCNLTFIFHSKQFVSMNNEAKSCFRLTELLSDSIVNGVEIRSFGALDELNEKCMLMLLFDTETKDLSLKLVYPRFYIIYKNESLGVEIGSVLE